MTDNLDLYRLFGTTPKEAQKAIPAGRLKGMTDINPMWRIKKLTEVFGACGVGWWTEIVKYELVPGHGNEVRAFMQINLYYVYDGVTSKPVPGFGGASYVTDEKSGTFTSDECYKMAFTDALGSACKMLGMSADIYFANDRTKYAAAPEQTAEKKAEVPKAAPKEAPKTAKPMNVTNADLNKLCAAVGILEKKSSKEVAAEAMKALGMTPDHMDNLALYAYLDSRLGEEQHDVQK